MKIYCALTGAVMLGLLLSFSGQARGEQTVFEGDTHRHVFQMLGEPSIEFPRGKKMIRWYDEYELEFIDDKVSSVFYNPKKTPTIEIEVVNVPVAGKNTNTNMNPQPGDELVAQLESNGVDAVAEVLETSETNQSAAVISAALSSPSVEIPSASISTNQ